MFAGPGPVIVENDWYTVHNPLDVTDLSTPILVAALGPTMLRTAGEGADRHDPLDGRREGDRRAHRAGGSTRPWPAPAGPRRASSWACRSRCARPARRTKCACVDEPCARGRRVLAELSDAARAGDVSDVGDMAAVGDEAAIVARLAATATPARPTLPCASSPGARPATSASPPATAPRPWSPPSRNTFGVNERGETPK